jgi:hypothetical protein
MFGIRARFSGDKMLSTKVQCKFEVEVVAPQEYGFTTFSLKIPPCFWGPGMDANSCEEVEPSPIGSAT